MFCGKTPKITNIFKINCLGKATLPGFFLLLFAFNLNSQNKTSIFKKNQKKSGDYNFYLDKDFNITKVSKARYKGTFFVGDNGSPKNRPTGRTGKSNKIVYTPGNDTSGKNYPLLLDGELNYFTTGRKGFLYCTEIYSQGKLKVYKEFLPSKKFSSPETITIYFDSLLNNNPNTFLYYHTDNKIDLYKQYVKYNKPVKRFYFVPYRQKYFTYRPLAGYHRSTSFGVEKGVAPREFIELGCSKKYVRSLYMDTTKRYYSKGNFEYLAFNASLLANYYNKSYRFGQKVTASYVLLIYRFEAGFINYHDFGKSDFRPLLGAGISVYHWANIMVNYSLPLIKNPFNDVSRLSLSVFIN